MAQNDDLLHAVGGRHPDPAVFADLVGDALDEHIRRLGLFRIDDMDVVIKDDCWIGGNSTILKGVTIETGCVIAAGAVVTKSTEPYGIYGGVPAKRLSDRFSN